MKFGAFTKKSRDTDTDFQGGGPMQEETKSWERLEKPATYSYAMVGLVSSILLMGASFLILGFIDPGEGIKGFDNKWKHESE